jgi:nitrite reductase/ring-hydroxylating ferredoxin subunit
MAMFLDVAAMDELVEAKPKIVTVAGREIGIVRWRDEVFALRNICPHQFGPVCGGYAMPMLTSDMAGTIDVDEDRLVVVCPWHNWEFDARTGHAAWADAPYKLKTYPVKLESGRVYVDAGRPAAESQPVGGAVE